MLKVVVFDSGFGGELFADYLEAELPIVEVIRVIDWRNTDKLLASSKSARKVAEEALRPYIGRVDLIIFANCLLSCTSLRFFKRKYKNQKFLGVYLEKPDTFIKKDVLVLTTKALAKTIYYSRFIHGLNRKTKTLLIDDWVVRIDDGELCYSEIRETILKFIAELNFEPKEIILGCTQLYDIKKEITQVFNGNIKIFDGFIAAIRATHKLLGIRGGNGKKRK